MDKKYDVTALGELLIDFISNGNSEQGNPLFEANPGGAPCNVLAMLSKLGDTTAFIGKVGDDMFGKNLKHILEECSINTDHMVMDPEVNTTLAFVQNFEGGEREFSFYRNPGADMMLREEEVDEETIKQSKIFHFGTLSMTHDGVCKATKKAIQIAKENNVSISFDPNLRELLWSSMELAKQQFEYGFQVCDILKIADNELVWFTGIDDLDEAMEVFRKKYPVKLILLTKGKDGSCAYYRDMKVEAGSFLQENTIDTTGAGDTFMGCCLHEILTDEMYDLLIDGMNDHAADNINVHDALHRMLLRANAAASIITTRKGALRSMPEPLEIEEVIEKMR